MLIYLFILQSHSTTLETFKKAIKYKHQTKPPCAGQYITLKILKAEGGVMC